jgi:hypothetical protein
MPSGQCVVGLPLLCCMLAAMNDRLGCCGLVLLLAACKQQMVVAVWLHAPFYGRSVGHSHGAWVRQHAAAYPK